MEAASSRDVSDGDVRVVAKRPGLFRLLISGFFTLVLIGICAMPGTSAPAYVIALFSIWIFGLQLALFLRPPTVHLQAGRLSMRRPLATLETSVDNVLRLHYTSKNVWLEFADVTKVSPPSRVQSLREFHEKSGVHLRIPGSFNSRQLEVLRSRLHLGPGGALVEDGLSQFETHLTELTPRLLVVPTIIFLNVSVFALMVLSSGSNPVNPNALTMVDWGANFGPLTRGGQWWRLVSSMFLHFGVLHLAVNMWVLWDIGKLVERIVGPTGFAAAYLLAGLFGGLASIAWNENVVSAGASGAVFGVFGLLLGFMAFHRDSIPAQAIRHIAPVLWHS